MAADVAGYSRLMGLDEIGTVRSLREHRAVTDALIAKHGGRIVKTAGDSLLLEFSSVIDAVECALAMQAIMAERNESVPQDRRMQFRIGINLGDILIEGDDIHGDGVNIASRLESIAEPGGICVSASAYDQVQGKVAVEFTDLGEQNLKNIARPVRAYAVARDGHGVAPRSGAARSTPYPAPRLSIVVLPFDNIGGDPEQDYFVDGVTESLTTDLSRISGSFVIARNTAFSYKGKSFDVTQVGRDLKVRYVLEGSVQRGGNRLRVNVQLIDAETGHHLWAERFDKPIADFLDMQDEIVSRLANTLDTQLVAAEARRAESSLSPDAMDLIFQGKFWMNKGITPQYLAQAREFFQRALELDPRNVEALGGLASIDTTAAAGYLTDERAARFLAAETAAIKALSLAPEHARIRVTLGAVLLFTNRAAQSIAEFERALTLNRNLAVAHSFIGLAKCYLGRAAETEAHVQDALRLSPRDALAYWWMTWAGMAKLYLGRDEEATMWLRRTSETNRNDILSHFALAAALAHLDRFDEARPSVQAGLALDPTFTLCRYRAGAVLSDNKIFLAQRERVYDGMRKAGVPEG